MPRINRPAHELAITTTPDVETFHVTDVDIQVVNSPKPFQLTLFPWDRHHTTKTEITLDIHALGKPDGAVEHLVFNRQHVVWVSMRERTLTRKPATEPATAAQHVP